jgi:hypothetical protein
MDIDEFRYLLAAAGTAAPFGLADADLPALAGQPLDAELASGREKAAGRGWVAANGKLQGEGGAIAGALAAPEATIRVLGHTDHGLKPWALFYVRDGAAVRVSLRDTATLDVETVSADDLLAAVRDAIPVPSMSQDFQISDLANVRMDVAGTAVVGATTGDTAIAFDLYDAVADPVWRGRVIFNAHSDGQPGPDHLLGVVQGQEFAFVVEPDAARPGFSTVETLQPGVIRDALARAWARLSA